MNLQVESYKNENLVDPPTLLCDIYKVSHREQYPDNTELIYSSWTPRMTRKKGINKVVAFGFQSYIKEYLISYFNNYFFKRPKEAVLQEYKEVIYFTLINPGNMLQVPEDKLDEEVSKVKAQHIADLHDLGYLPIKIKAIKEGMATPIRVPQLTVENTNKKFFWLTNYLETQMSAQIWMPSTSATIAKKYKEILTKYALETVGNADFVPFQGHDFSMRGMAGIDAAKASGAGHLVPFVGTDSIPAIHYLRKYYNADIRKELTGTSVPATEHSVMCANGQDELAVMKDFITNKYPNGIVSIVSDTWDFWNVVENVLTELKPLIMQRDGKVVIRPDSGDPVEIICGKVIPEFESIHTANAMFKKLAEEMKGEVFIFKVKGQHYKTTVDYQRHATYIKTEDYTLTAEDKGLVESLWDIFGGTISNEGYKVLDSHIGGIYGDAITLERVEEICKRLKDKGFASTNMVYGIGSFTYQYNTRDTFGFAMKSTYANIDGVEKQLFKDPKTDTGNFKKSQRGKVVVLERDGEITYIDGLDEITHKQYEGVDLLEDVFCDGKLLRDQTLTEIRAILETQTL